MKAWLKYTLGFIVIIVITGDILHSKSDLSPECIELTYGLIKSLVNLLPVIIIPGNHDLNINKIIQTIDTVKYINNHAGELFQNHAGGYFANYYFFILVNCIINITILF